MKIIAFSDEMTFLALKTKIKGGLCFHLAVCLCIQTLIFLEGL
jgi:hypothetical protein